jgi:formylglycine-generating enzyme required for sulfatase activity
MGCLILPFRMRRLPDLGILLTLSVAGCGGGGAAPPDADAVMEPDANTGSPDADQEGGPSLAHCPAEPDVHGPALTRVRWEDGVAFCIDSTEVTNGQYAQFLAANVAISTQGARCGWNQSFAPESKSTNGPACPTFDPTGRADYPVVCVDWCDADAYCRWAGKHLCQKPGGGPVASYYAKDSSEWVIACTGDGTKKYPYGDMAMAGQCVDQKYPAQTPGLRPAGSAVMCEGGVPGLFDMSGNAWEWQDDCHEQSTMGDEDACAPLGGSFSTDVASAACTDGAPFFRKQVAGDTGFRCCVDAQFF